MSSLILNRLWAFIESLSLSQQERYWLAGKLQESSFNVDPYEVSPSGDAFFADSRNVKAVEDDIAAAHAPGAKFTRLESEDDIMALMESL
ncbi:MAG: hypothetical protein K6A32_09350 [Bacteroidales bacterium]|nr:hypothetical protein [Bacteroidales bacterium]